MQNVINNTFKILSSIVDTADFENASESIKGLFDSDSISIKSTVLKNAMIGDDMPVAELIKIGIMLILCLASFLIGFNCQKKALASGSNAEDAQQKNAAEFDKDHSNEKKLDDLVDQNKDEINVKSKKKNDLMDDDDAKKLLDEMAEIVSTRGDELIIKKTKKRRKALKNKV